jgi:hypothetical protein
MGELINPVLSKLKKENMAYLDGINVKQISGAWERRLCDASLIYDQFRRIKRKPRTLLVTGGTNPYRKAMVLAFQREGVDVKVFHHGNDVGGRIQEHGHRAEVSHCREFVCPTESIAENYRKCYSTAPIESRSETHYSSLETEYYRRLSRRLAGIPGGSIENSVMLVGRPLNSLRLLDANGGFFLHKIDVEARLIRYLSAIGKNVTYKPHPEWVGLARKLYSTLPCKIIEGEISSVLSEIEVAIFTTATTTAFELSLCSRRAVVLLDAEGNAWNEDPRKTIEERCEILDYQIDSFGRASLDKRALKAALEVAKNKSENTSFCQKLMYPKPR